MSERANIRDVAARAGVAVKTVSRVLNGHPYVSAEKREAVEAAMRALDFRPSIAARILTGAKSNQVALIYDNHSPYYMFQIQSGCWEFCKQNGIRLLAQPVDVADPLVGQQVRGLVSETHVDGIILSSPVTDCEPVLRQLEALDIPFVRISPGTNHALTSSVFMDDAQAADDMTTHLINVGHRRIGFIKGHPNHMASDDRLFGYRRALDRAGIGYEPALVQDGAFDFDSGVAAARQFLTMRDRPTAIFAANDDMAAGVLAVAHEMGIDVPGRLSVAGFDDTTLARTVWPPLTTIHQPMAELARAAAEILIAGGDLTHRRLPHTLVERASVAPPPRNPA
ncbi:MAG: LacI family DNA-binding transcriptional regulator [Sphingomonadales bacterium]|nr:LacI family DNA-binding transcriptional regulator [Sphingomonadales bacterium]